MVAVLVTIFPASQRYLSDFFENLFNQTYSDFHLIVVNDGVEDLGQYIQNFEPNRYTILSPEKTFIGNRLKAMNYAKENRFEKVICCDSDDLASANRVEECVNLLNEYSIVVNDVDLMELVNRK